MRLDPSPHSSPARLQLVDAARGLALVAMAIYHFSWDLRYFGFISTDVTAELGWRIFARLIAGSFLALVGVSLVLSMRSGFNRRRFIRRLGLIAAAAAGISVVTWFLFPEGWIFFGILHCIAVASVLALPFIRAPLVLVGAAALFCFAAPRLFSAPVFDSPALLWLGLATYLPRSNDFVPIFPWFGVVLAGIVAARIAIQVRPSRTEEPHGASAVLRPLAWAGRHSLGIYLVHQPLLFGLVLLAAEVIPPNLIGFEASYLQSCSSSCVESELDAALCGRICACLVDRSKAEDLWTGLARNSLSADEVTRYYDLADQCRAASASP